MSNPVRVRFVPDSNCYNLDYFLSYLHVVLNSCDFQLQASHRDPTTSKDLYTSLDFSTFLNKAMKNQQNIDFLVKIKETLEAIQKVHERQEALLQSAMGTNLTSKIL